MRAGMALIPFSMGLPLGSLAAGTIAMKTGRYRYLSWTILLLILASTNSELYDGICHIALAA